MDPIACTRVGLALDGGAQEIQKDDNEVEAIEYFGYTFSFCIHCYTILVRNLDLILHATDTRTKLPVS